MLPLLTLIHRYSALDGCCSYPRPRNFQVCRSSSACLSVRRSAHIGGTTSTVRNSVKQSPTFWTANSNRPASERISASRSLCSCVALGMRDHPQLDDRIVELRRANQRRRSIPDCKFEIPHERCYEATNNAFFSRELIGPPNWKRIATGELPPQLLTLSKKLDEELLKKQEHSAVA